jgi:hypothetical protein
MEVGGIQVIAVFGLALLAGGGITFCVGLYEIVVVKTIIVLGIGLGLLAAGGVLLWIAHKASSAI